MKAFYRVSEVMEILSIGRTKAYDMIRSGAIPSVEIDGNIRVPVKLFNDWIDSKIAGSTAERTSSAPTPVGTEKPQRPARR